MDLSVVIASRPNVPPEEELRTAALADRLGFADLWIGEGFVWDAFALATAAGARTERIPLTVGPIPVSVRDPASIARGAASVAALTGRRTGVALGTSSLRVVERMHGRSRRRPVTTLAESAQAVRRLFAGDVADFAGDMVASHDYRIRLGPPGGTITLAAFGDKAIAAAARYADRMVLDLVTPGQVRGLRARLTEAAAEAGRPVPRLAAWIPAAVDPTPEAEAQVADSLAGYLEVAGYAEVLAESGGAIGLVGAAGTVRSRLDAYAEAGLDELVAVPATAGDPGGERSLTALAQMYGPQSF